MKKCIFIILFFCSLFQVSAQEKYRVTYDYLTDEITYFKLNKLNEIKDTLNKPRFKRNSLIELKLINVNPFATNVKTDVKEEDIHPSNNGFNFSSLLGGINSFAGDNLNLNVDNLPKENSFFANGGQSRGKKLNNKFSELNQLSSSIEAIKTTFLSNLLNPNLNKEKILTNLKSVAINIEDSRLPDPKDNFYLYVSSLDNAIKEDSKEIENQISTISLEVSESLNKDASLSRGELVLKTNAYNSLQELASNIRKKQLATSETLKKIQSLYASLEASSFEQTYDYLIEADKVSIELQFKQSKLSDDNEESTVIKTRNLKLFSKGGFKINTSVALTLNNFGEKSRDFYISEDNTVGEDINNHFAPSLSTMINFYPVVGENFNVGGSFGLSIPISGESKGLSFLLGPSVFLGSKSRLSLSGGVAYGPVNKLTNGLEVGETTNYTDIDGFIKSVYDFGYYFGISFSLFDIK